MSDTWKTMSHFAFTLPHKPGEVARFAAGASDAGINMLGLWGYAPGEDQPRFSCVPSDADAFRAFASEAGIPIEEGTALYVSGKSKPGSLVETLRRIADAGINLDAIEAVGSGNHFGCFIWATDANREALQNLLT